MYLMIEKGIRGEITQAVHKYCKANNKYMDKEYNKNKASSYLQYYDANSLYALVMTQKLSLDSFEFERVSKYTSNFIKHYNEDSDVGYILEIDVEYSKNLHDLHSDLSFLPGGRKINKRNELICDPNDRNKYVAHIKLLKQALNHGSILKKVHRVSSFNQEAWMNDYIITNITNIEERKKANSDFEKDFYKLMCNSVFGKSMENVRNHKDMTLVTTDKRRSQLVSESNYYYTKCFSEDLLAVEVKKQ